MPLDTKNPCQKICQCIGRFVKLTIFRFRIIARILQEKLSTDKLSQTIILSLSIAGFYKNLSFWLCAFFTLGLCFWGLWKYRRIPFALAVDMYEDTECAFLAREFARQFKKTIGECKRGFYKDLILEEIKKGKLLLFGKEFPLNNSKPIYPKDVECLRLSEDLSSFVADGQDSKVHNTDLLIGVKELHPYIEQKKEVARQAREFEKNPCKVIDEMEKEGESEDLSGEKTSP